MLIAILVVLFALGVVAFIPMDITNVFLAAGLLVVGILMVIKGGDVFVDGAANIAKALNIPTFIIGATIVSLATTLPELLVSVFATAEGTVDMAVGNAVGSVTANTALILAVGMCAMTMVFEKEKHLLPILLLIAATLTLFLGSMAGSLSYIAAIILAVIFIAFMVFNVLTGKRHQAQLKALDENAQGVDKKDLFKNVSFFVVGAVALAGGSRFMVNNATTIATYFGVSDLIISLTILAVGTSLPELVTTITAITKKETNLSIGNIIGANVIDITLILPICSLIAGKQLPINIRSVYVDLPALVTVTLIAMLPIVFAKKSSKAQGIALLALYAAYLAVVVLCEVGVISL